MFLILHAFAAIAVIAATDAAAATAFAVINVFGTHFLISNARAFHTLSEEEQSKAQDETVIKGTKKNSLIEPNFRRW